VVAAAPDDDGVVAVEVAERAPAGLACTGSRAVTRLAAPREGVAFPVLEWRFGWQWNFERYAYMTS
jgi:hypothetical protein